MNDRGLLMGTMSKNLAFPMGAIKTEAKMIEEGIALAWDLGLKHVVIEGDAKQVLEALIDPGTAPC